MTDPIHIVTSFDGIGGTEAHARSLADRLAHAAPIQLWATQPSRAAAHYRALPISPFGGQMPRGGTLILVGSHIEPGIWLDYVKPRRLIVICNGLSARQTLAFLAWLDRPGLPTAELAFVSNAVRAAMALPGRLCPPLIDLDKFHPARRIAGERFRVGRHSREDAALHHPDDPSLYKMLCWNGLGLRLMGAMLLEPYLGGCPNLELLPVGTEAPATFLGQLDLFFYRTASQMQEASGWAVIEALACGLPVVAHVDGGHADWITNGENGYLFATQEEAYERVTELAGSPERCTALRQSARQTAERLCGEEAVGEYLNWASHA